MQKYHIFETELHFAFPTMLQSVAWLSFSVFGGSLKIENWKLQSIFNFCFSAETLKIVDRTTEEGGRGVHSHGNVFAPSALSPDPLPSMRILFFCPCLLPPHPRYISLERKKREIRVYRAVTFPNMNDFSAEYIKDLVITQRKTDSEVSLLLKERSVRRFFLEWDKFTQPPVKWWALAMHAGRRCSDKYKFIRLNCLFFAIFFFFLPWVLCLYSCLYEHPSGFKILFQLLAWICRLLSRLVFFPGCQ